jgi:biopolymer transport protein ExbD
MAEIQTSETYKKKGERRSKKLSTKVDLTPMVDLGFLLITFFVFTTSISKPTVMNLNMPDESPDSMVTAEGKTLNVLLAADNVVYYYFGDSINSMHSTDFSSQGLRAVIRDKKQQVQQKYGDGKETVILIKPLPDATYSNVVDALDEIEINMVDRYVLLDAGKEETGLLLKH